MSYHVTKFDYLEEDGELFKLWQELLDYPSLARMEWFYKDSYYGQPDTWFLKADSKIVGSVSLSPVYFKFWNQSLKVGLAVDFMVKKKYRSFGPALMLQKAIIKEYEALGYKVILGYPTKRGLGVVLRAGYRELGVIKRYTKILKTETKLKKYISNNRLRKYTACVADFLLTISSRNTWQNLMLRNGLISKLSVVSGYKAINPPFNIFCKLEPEYLKWRFVSVPHKETALFEIKENDRIVGYISYLLNDDTVNIDGIYIFDFNKHADMALTKFISNIKKTNVKSISISYFGNRLYINLFKKHGFFERESDRYIVFHSQSGVADEVLLSENNWCLFDGDIDV